MAKSKSLATKFVAAAIIGTMALGSINLATAGAHEASEDAESSHVKKKLREGKKRPSKAEHSQRVEQFKEKRAEKKEKYQSRLNEISNAANLSEDQKARLDTYFKEKHKAKRAEIASKCGVNLEDKTPESRNKLMACLKKLKSEGGKRAK